MKPIDEDYREFVAAHPQATVWHSAELVQALVLSDARLSMQYCQVEEGGRIVGIWPLCIKRRQDGRVVTMPALMRYCSPLLEEVWLASVGESDALARLNGVLPEGIKSIDQDWPAGLDVGPLSNMGWAIRKRTTHLADLRDGAAALSARRSQQMRYDLRRAGERLHIQFTEQLNEADLQILQAPYARQGVALPYPEASLRAIMAALGPHGQAVGVRVLDTAERMLGMAILLRDTQSGYALLTGSSEAGRRWSAGSFALAAGIEWARTKGCERFDFLGSDTTSIADTFRRLGGVASSYTHVSHDCVFWTRALRQWRG